LAQQRLRYQPCITTTMSFLGETTSKHFHYFKGIHRSWRLWTKLRQYLDTMFPISEENDPRQTPESLRCHHFVIHIGGTHSVADGAPCNLTCVH
jgi:hypothetical protein